MRVANILPQRWLAFGVDSGCRYEMSIDHQSSSRMAMVRHGSFGGEIEKTASLPRSLRPLTIAGPVTLDLTGESVHLASSAWMGHSTP